MNFWFVRFEFDRGLLLQQAGTFTTMTQRICIVIFPLVVVGQFLMFHDTITIAIAANDDGIVIGWTNRHSG